MAKAIGAEQSIIAALSPGDHFDRHRVRVRRRALVGVWARRAGPAVGG
jgi:hypothetical protein